MEKKKKSQRRRAKSPATVVVFGRRVGQLLAETHTRQADFAKTLGGFAPQVISRLVNAQATTAPIDLIVRLAEWADERGYALRWLFMGVGPTKKADMDSFAEAAVSSNRLAACRLVLELASQVGVDLSSFTETSDVMLFIPEWGVVSLKLDEALAHLAEAIGPPAGEPGYATATADEVAATSDWRRAYVPILGRVAAVDAEEIAVPGKLPPPWAGDYLVCTDAPQAAIAVRVAGSAMAPEYNDGDIVIADTTAEPPTAAACVALIDVDDYCEPRVTRLDVTSRFAILESVNAEVSAKRIGRKRLLGAYSIVTHIPR